MVERTLGKGEVECSIHSCGTICSIYIEKEYIPNTKKDRIICETISGSIIGIGEIFFMPFDVLKIKKQTNINTFNNRSLYQIIKQENYYNRHLIKLIQGPK